MSTFRLDPLVEVMQRLRSDDGCPWDRQQTHQSLRSFVIEEAYEVVEAINLEDMNKLSEELGDLLLQVVFHSELASEKGIFDVNDVIDQQVDKLIRRHPHVFSRDEAGRFDSAEEVLDNWESLKNRETPEEEVIDLDAPETMPALMRAARIQRKASAYGFDWETAGGPLNKIKEELAELDQVHQNRGTVERRGPADDKRLGVDERLGEEIGDLLFSVVNYARKVDINPELALQDAIRKFERRFGAVAALARQAEQHLEEVPADELNQYWEQVKRDEASKRGFNDILKEGKPDEQE